MNEWKEEIRSDSSEDKNVEICDKDFIHGILHSKTNKRYLIHNKGKN